MASPRSLLAPLATLAATLAACDDAATRPPALDDCELHQEGALLVCPRSFPGCELAPHLAVIFERCGTRSEYIVYGRDEGCPELYVYPEGVFLSPADWEAQVGACGGKSQW